MNRKTYPDHRFLQLTAMLVICLLAGTAFGQSLANVKLDERHQTFTSDLMKREMHYRVILPADYAKNKDARYPVSIFSTD